jgi:hypothetical protein
MSKILSYIEVRDQLKDGDVLLYRGQGMFATSVRLLFKSPYSHAGIVVWWGNRLMVMEAVGKGVIASPLSQNLRRTHGGVDCFQYKSALSDDKRAVMVEFAQLQLGKEYNLWVLLVSGMRALLRLSLQDKNGQFRHAAGKYFCSQYVSDIYDQAGIDLNINLDSTRTSPAAIADSPLLEFHGKLKLE